MKKEILDKIIAGKKNTLRIDGFIYDIHLDWSKGLAYLTPRGGGSIATAVKFDSYEYTHGGTTYRKAVDVSHEIEEAMRKKIGTEV
ncbi:hypothetical protein DRZ78_01755 [Candidatus Aerophobetes bacterium]|uniref:Uncharacterized protein n=1 Tax=Aerophobetes bacterium TaxID=2030807 RepID=A0A662D5S3_UNCAE|nr:MAG: hypothetical protein DRZ78_01755 [Candidatus Aerophobetes bacterium]